MRDEMLKKLDALIDNLSSRERLKEWFVLRAELEAEQCDHCQHWNNPNSLKSGACHHVGMNDLLTESDFFCCHFRKMV